MGYVNYESAKDLVRMCLFERKLSLFKEVAIFSIIKIIICFKIGFICIVIVLFSGIFDLEPVVWTMRTVNLQTIWSESAYLKKVVIM